MIRIKIGPEIYWIALFAAAKLAVHLLTATNYELHRDEYLYIAEGCRLDFGFASTPPFTALMARTSHWLLGDSPFAYRFLPALIGAVTMVLVGATALAMGGKAWAVVTACSATLLSISYLRVNSMLQPVPFDVFFWVASGFLAIRMLKTGDPKHWRMLGLVWGLAFLNKYAIVFFIAAFLAALALTPGRILFKSRHLWTGAGIAFLIALPNLVWQFGHHWPVVHHMAELQRTQLVHASLRNFLLDQIIMNVHAIAVWGFGLFALTFLKRERGFRPLALAVWICLGLLIAARGKSYYSLGIYPILFAAGAAALENRLPGRRKTVLVLLLALMGISIPLAPYGLPLLKHDAMAAFGRASPKPIGYVALRWETGEIHELPQDYSDMTGWKELADLVIEAYQRAAEQGEKDCWIYTGNYGEAAAIRYYGQSAGLPEPVCFNDQFLLWTPDSLACGALIHVDHDTSDIRRFFRTMTEVGAVTNRYARERGLPVLLCSGPLEALKQHYRAEREERLRVYRRSR